MWCKNIPPVPFWQNVLLFLWDEIFVNARNYSSKIFLPILYVDDTRRIMEHIYES